MVSPFSKKQPRADPEWVRPPPPPIKMKSKNTNIAQISQFEDTIILLPVSRVGSCPVPHPITPFPRISHWKVT